MFYFFSDDLRWTDDSVETMIRAVASRKKLATKRSLITKVCVYILLKVVHHLCNFFTSEYSHIVNMLIEQVSFDVSA